MSFSRLIDKFSSNFLLAKEREGEMVDGRWVEGQKEVFICNGVIKNLSDEEVNLYEGGKYTSNDIKIRVVDGLKGTVLEEDGEEGYKLPEEVVFEEVEMEKDDIVFYKGERFKVDRRDRRSEIGDYINYVASKQSVSQGVIEIV